MIRGIVPAFLLLFAATVYSQSSGPLTDGYGTKVDFTYAPIDPGYLGVKTLGTLHDPNFGPKFVDSPVWSPDGKYIAFTDLEYIFLVPAEGGEAKMKYASVFLYPYKDSNLILYETVNKLVGFAQDGETLYFMHNLMDEESGTVITVTGSGDDLSISINSGELKMALASLDIETGEVETVARNIFNAALSRSGKYLMYFDQDRKLMHVKDLAAGGEWAAAVPEKFDFMFTFSADEKYIVYSGIAGDGSYQLFRMPVQGGAAEQLSANPGGDTGFNRFNPVCSPDGEWILYDDWGTKKYSNDITTSEGHISYDKFIVKMCAFNMRTGETRDLFPASTYIDTWHGQLSPDGKKVCYSRRNFESFSEKNGLYIQDIFLPVSDPGQLGVVDAAPQGFALTGNYPNPFNPSTHIAFTIPSSGTAHLSVYDVTGRKVRDLVSSALPAGAHEMVWDGRDDAGAAVSSGTYIARLKMGSLSAAHRMLLVK